MWNAFRSGGGPIPDIAEGKKKRYKIAYAEKMIQIQLLDHLLLTYNLLWSLRYKNSSHRNQLF